jgi:hypothetical protein
MRAVWPSMRHSRWAVERPRTVQPEGAQALVVGARGQPCTMSQERPPIENLGIVCDCGDANHDHTNSLLAEVYARLGQETETFRARTITPANFTAEVIRSLEWDLGVHIEHIYCDQWFGIRAEDRNDERVVIQGDRVEHGLAALWKRYADAQGLSPPASEERG